MGDADDDDVRILTYNGLNFDIDGLYKRAGMLGLMDSDRWEKHSNMMSRYHEDEHIDISNKLWGYGKYVSLSHTAKMILGEDKIDFDVKTIPELIKTEEGRATLMEYNLRDAELTYKIANHMGII
mgnify:CR=1 FL=1